MRAEIPDHADIALMQSQVDAAGRDEVELSEVPRVDQLANRSHRRAVQEGVATHERELALAGQRDQLLRQRARGRERLLHERVLARLQTTATQLVVREHGGGEQDSVEVGVVQELIEVLGQPHGRVASPIALEPGHVGVADPPQLGVGALDQHPHEVGAPVAEADHGDRRVNAKAPHADREFRADRRAAVPSIGSPTLRRGRPPDRSSRGRSGATVPAQPSLVASATEDDRWTLRSAG